MMKMQFSSFVAVNKISAHIYIFKKIAGKMNNFSETIEQLIFNYLKPNLQMVLNLYAIVVAKRN